MKRGFAVVDMLVATGIAASIVLWASIWAHPYPHPGLWPFLAMMRHGVPLCALISCVWRSAQFLSPRFALLTVAEG